MTLADPLLWLVLVPLIGAAAGSSVWSRPATLKTCLQLTSLASLAAVAWASGKLPEGAAPVPLLAALPIAAFASLLGQPAHQGNREAWLSSVLFLVLALGVLTSPPGPGVLWLLAALAVVLFRGRRDAGHEAWWGIGTAALGTLAALVAWLSAPPVSLLTLSLACAVLLPLMPFHKSYVAAIAGLPGNLPAFLSLLLPVTGFHAVRAVLPQLPHPLLQGLALLALAGMLYGSVKALVQARPPLVVAYGSSAFASILWWYVASTGAAPPHALVFVIAIGLASLGLLLSWYALRCRLGEIGLAALGGLAKPMPRFAVAVSLLTVAALGLPPFGPFAGFLGMLLAPSVTWSAQLMLVLAVWLCASWYLFDLVQRLLFGRPAVEHGRWDLGGHELASLAIVLVLLFALGVIPSRLFDQAGGEGRRTVALESFQWTK